MSDETTIPPADEKPVPPPAPVVPPVIPPVCSAEHAGCDHCETCDESHESRLQRLEEWIKHLFSRIG